MTSTFETENLKELCKQVYGFIDFVYTFLYISDRNDFATK